MGRPEIGNSKLDWKSSKETNQNGCKRVEKSHERPRREK
jgi:hypothetical protein